MEVLVVGSGGREHAIAWRLATSSGVDTIYCAPGNGGTSMIAQNVAQPIKTEMECEQLAHWAYQNRIDLVIVGPEVPLRYGMVDTLMTYAIPVLGPTQAAARLEWSKAWARDFMQRQDIPSPKYDVLEGIDAVKARLNDPATIYPLVLKADGLAAGKGAEVVRSPEEAEDALNLMRTVGALPQDGVVKFVLEEYLEGVEVSALAFTDGETVAMMPPVCDYKRLLDGDKGPLTGGMGAYSPSKYATPELWAMVETEIILRAVKAMSSEGTPYRGVLYAGLMLTENGPKVLEFNSRFGDPETQVLLPKLKTPLEDIALAIAGGRLAELGPLEWSNRATVGVVLASEGYPVSQDVHKRVEGLADIDEGVLVFHAGTSLRGAVSINPIADFTEPKTSMLGTLFGRKRESRFGQMSSDLVSPNIEAVGGRILTVVASAATLGEARDIAYRNIARIKAEGTQFWGDIALREIEPERTETVPGVPAPEEI